MIVATPKRIPHELPSGELGLNCNNCRRDLPLAMFHKHTRSACGYQTTCKECQRFRMKKQHYGIDRADYESMRTTQGAMCAICGAHESSASCTYKHLVVDHCHSTGAVRALLCDNCNKVLGKVNDDVDRLKAMIAYLERFTALPQLA